MPPEESPQNPPQVPPQQPSPTTRLEPPMAVGHPVPENRAEQPVSPPQPTTEIRTPQMTVPQSPLSRAPSSASPPPSATAPKGALFWSLVGSAATIVLVGAGFYLYGMYLSGATPSPVLKSPEPVVRDCGTDAGCLANAVAACAPARATVSIDDALSFVVARSVLDVAVTGAKSDLSCGVLITQTASAAALPDSFFEAAKIPEAERGAVNEQFAKDNAEPNALLDALTGLDATCSFSPVGVAAFKTFLTRFGEIEYIASSTTSIAGEETTSTTPTIITKLDGIPVDVDFWRECSGSFATNRPKALEDAAPLIKVK